MAIALIPYGRTIVMHISSHLLLSKGSHSRNCVNVALIFLTLPAGNSIVQQCTKEKARERERVRGRVQLVDLLSTRRQFAAAAFSQSSQI